jgi:DNA polymerase III epsilon subunit-like protein
MREIVIDTETTGLDPLSGNRIVEIGAVELGDRCPTGNTFHCYLWPERSVPADAHAVHGLSAEFLADKPVFGAVADEFLAFVGHAPLVAHNASFDIAFLNAELKHAAKPVIATERVIAEYTERFADNRIDLSVLADLTDQHLEKLGMALGNRLKILRAIRELSVVAVAQAAAAALAMQDSAERCQLTVMFADLVGSTATSRRASPGTGLPPLVPHRPSATQDRPSYGIVRTRSEQKQTRRDRRRRFQSEGAPGVPPRHHYASRQSCASLSGHYGRSAAALRDLM